MLRVGVMYSIQLTGYHNPYAWTVRGVPIRFNASLPASSSQHPATPGVTASMPARSNSYMQYVTAERLLPCFGTAGIAVMRGVRKLRQLQGGDVPQSVHQTHSRVRHLGTRPFGLCTNVDPQLRSHHHAIGHVLARRLRGPDDPHDLATGKPIVARHWVGELNAR